MKQVLQIVCVAVVSLVLMPFQVSAETLEIKSHTADGSANLNGIPGQHGDTQAYLVAGMSGEPIEPRSAIMFFELPTVDDPNDLISADLRLYYVLGGEGNDADDGADVWGLGYQNAPSIDHAWYHASEMDAGAGVNVPTRTKIQDDIICGVSPSENQYYSTDQTGDGNLLAFLRDVYDSGAQGGDCAIVRLNFDSAPAASPRERYEVASADFAGGSYVPAITLEVIPEPVTLSLLALGGLAMVWRRRNVQG